MGQGDPDSRHQVELDSIERYRLVGQVDKTPSLRVFLSAIPERAKVQRVVAVPENGRVADILSIA